MATYIALVRAINLGSRNRVAMSDLRALAVDLGFSDVASYVQSGNLVFRTTARAGTLEGLLERETAKRLGIQTEFMVRTASRWRSIIASNPFPREAARAPARLLVMVCKEAAGRSLKVSGQSGESVRAVGKEIYVYYPEGMGRSRLRLSARGTMRNWNTVLKLEELARAAGG